MLHLGQVLGYRVGLGINWRKVEAWAELADVKSELGMKSEEGHLHAEYCDKGGDAAELTQIKDSL